MGWRHLRVERAGPVWTCRIGNPPRHTLTAQGVRELTELVEAAEAEPGLRVLVFEGEGQGVFIAHYEVGELAAASEAAPGPAPEPSGPARLHPFHRLLLRMERLDALTVAALNGSAAGGGCEFSLACDFRLLCDGPHHVGLPETGVGIIPGAGGTQRLARLLGTAAALDLILHARLLTPPEALAAGLVHRVFPAETFSQDVRRFVADLADRAPIAMAAAKQAIRAGADLPLEQGLALEQACFERTLRSADAARALRAWLEGKTVVWRGA